MDLIRLITPEDAADYRWLREALVLENEWMSVSKGDIGHNVKSMADRIRNYRDNQLLFLLFDERDTTGPVGYCGCFAGDHIRTRHIGRMTLASLRGFSSRMGLLLRRALGAAFEVGITRVEGTVVFDNEAALRFYDRLGFEREGVRRGSFWYAGKYYDEYYYSLLAGRDGFKLSLRRGGAIGSIAGLLPAGRGSSPLPGPIAPGIVPAAGI